jgi:hypothetical protein
MINDGATNSTSTNVDSHEHDSLVRLLAEFTADHAKDDANDDDTPMSRAILQGVLEHREPVLPAHHRFHAALMVLSFSLSSIAAASIANNANADTADLRPVPPLEVDDEPLVRPAPVQVLAHWPSLIGGALFLDGLERLVGHGLVGVGRGGTEFGHPPGPAEPERKTKPDYLGQARHMLKTGSTEDIESLYGKLFAVEMDESLRGQIALEYLNTIKASAQDRLAVRIVCKRLPTNCSEAKKRSNAKVLQDTE